MRMKRGALIILVSFLFFPLVQAGPIDGLRQVLYWFEGFMSVLTEFVARLEASDPYFFAKMLMAFLFYIVVYNLLHKNQIFSDKKKLNVIISLCIAILALRYIPNNEFFIAMLLPYNSLALALMTFIPLLIYFYFIHQAQLTGPGRKIAWIIYGLSFGGIWAYRKDELAQTGNTIYLIGLIFLFLMLIFDKKIHAYFHNPLRYFRSSTRAHMAAKARREIHELTNNAQFYRDRDGQKVWQKDLDYWNDVLQKNT